MIPCAAPRLRRSTGVPLPDPVLRLPDAWKKLPLTGDLANALPKDLPPRSMAAAGNGHLVRKEDSARLPRR
ncbi:hypothetical protein ALI144C_46945 [Actinosynnema sp. ALI-1.44]|nr:hypothetical protein ALI144C_46945 [Actinosynnema sp. ALI-1.44]